jgi:TolA-binding protein
MVFEKEAPPDVSGLSSEIVKMVNTNTRRIRMIEQRLSGTERRISSLEEKIIDEIDNLRRGFEQIYMDIKALTENLSQIRAETLKMNKNLDKTAKKAEVRELESLLDLYNPIKSKFVTREEVERLIEEKKS